MKIVIYVRSYRLRKNLSLQQLSRLSGVAVSTLSEIENGVTLPTLPTLCKIAAALGIPWHLLVECGEKGALEG